MAKGRIYYAAKHPKHGYLTHYDGPLVQHTIEAICEELREYVYSDWARDRPIDEIIPRRKYEHDLNVFAHNEGWKVVRVRIVELRK